MSAVFTKDFVLDKFTAVDFLLGDTSRRILLNDVSWAEYERFLEDFETRPGWRLAYNGGKLEIMPPTIQHERFSITFNDFVRDYCMFFDLEMESGGSTTFQSEELRKGVEPDECFYIQSVKRLAGKDVSKPYPIPDIAVEVDITTESLDKFPIYAALEVPELWIYDGKILSFYKLDGGKYHQITRSRALGKLSAKDLAKFLEISRKKGQTAALKSFRVWLGKITK